MRRRDRSAPHSTNAPPPSASTAGISSARNPAVPTTRDSTTAATAVRPPTPITIGPTTTLTRDEDARNTVSMAATLSGHGECSPSRVRPVRPRLGPSSGSAEQGRRGRKRDERILRCADRPAAGTGGSLPAQLRSTPRPHRHHLRADRVRRVERPRRRRLPGALGRRGAGPAHGEGRGDLSATLAGRLDASTRIGVDGYAGAEAHANAYSHATRNDDGNISGWSVGFDGGLFAGAKADADFSSV